MRKYIFPDRQKKMGIYKIENLREKVIKYAFRPRTKKDSRKKRQHNIDQKEPTISTMVSTRKTTSLKKKIKKP